jgi:hypothetical protein
VAADIRERWTGPRTGCACYDLSRSAIKLLPAWFIAASNRPALTGILDGLLVLAGQDER